MDWDCIRDQWQSRSTQARDAELPLPRGAEKLWHRIRRRDWVETVIALLLVLLFVAAAGLLWHGGLLVSAGFAVWLAVACLIIPLRLRRARKLFPARESDRSLLDFLHQERRALRRQRDLLSTVLWWYVGPIAVGALGFFIGIRGLHWHSLAYAAVVLFIGFAIERANQAAVRRSIDPAIRSVDKQIQQLEQENE